MVEFVCLQPPQILGNLEFFGQKEKFGQSQLFKMFSSCFLNREIFSIFT